MSVGAFGATRNRTELFLKYRAAARGSSRPLGLGQSSSPGKQAERGTHRLLEAALNSTVENGEELVSAAGVASSLPPQYVDFKEQIRTEMFLIKQKMNELRALHGKATLTTFDDTGGSEVEIEVITQDITRLFRKCEARLQRFSSGTSTSEADEKVKQNVQRTLAIELQRLSVQFRKQQKAYLSRLRSKDGSLGSASFAALEEGRNGDDDVDPGFSELQGMKAGTNDLIAEERDKEVQQILRSINDLAQIMKDLSVLVIDQGTILDRIDYNMEQVAVKVEEGVKQLTKAEKTQKNSRLVLCIMFLLCVMVLMVFIFLFRRVVPVIAG